jgi:hypothetical protein
MIPSHIAKLCDRKNALRKPEDMDCVVRELELLNIAKDSGFAQVALRYDIGNLTTLGRSLEELIDLCCPDEQISSTTEWVRLAWEIPENFIPITTCEGKGGYLYDRNTDSVWYFELAFREEFLEGKCEPMFDTFFEFLNWYLGASNAKPPR